MEANVHSILITEHQLEAISIKLPFMTINGSRKVSSC